MFVRQNPACEGKTPSRARALFIGLYLLMIAGLFAVAIAHGYQWVDGAWNAQVAVNFAKTGSYATTYPLEEVFSISITTGQTVLLPAALCFKLLGATPLAAALPGIVYMCAAILALDWLLTRYFSVSGFSALKSVLLGGLCTAGCVYSYSLYGRYAHQLLGEGATVFFLVLACLMLARYSANRNPLSAAACGALLACALITKTVAVCFLLVFLLLMLLECFVTRRFQKRTILFLLGGFLFAFAALESFKFFQLNTSYYRYRVWWENTFIYSFDLSSGSAQALPFIERIAANIGAVADLLCAGNPVALVLLLLLAPGCYLLSAIARLTKREDPFAKPHRFALLALGLCGDGFLVASILFTSGGMFAERRLLIHGVCFLAFALALLVEAAASFFTAKKRIARVAAVSALALCLFLAPRMISGVKNHLFYSGSEDAQRARSVRTFMQAAKALPQDANLYGWGWNFAAETSLFADLDLINLTANAPDLSQGEHYLLVESYPPDSEITKHYTLTPVWRLDDGDAYVIYRLSPPASKE